MSVMAYQLLMTTHSPLRVGGRRSYPVQSELIDGECPYSIGEPFEYGGATWTVTGASFGKGDATIVECERHADPRARPDLAQL